MSLFSNVKTRHRKALALRESLRAFPMLHLSAIPFFCHQRVRSPFQFLVLLCCLAAFCARGQAPPQFDVFLGYDGLVPEATWFPLQCEVKNDGPPFIGIIEVEPGNANPGQVRRMVVELPTGQGLLIK